MIVAQKGISTIPPIYPRSVSTSKKIRKRNNWKPQIFNFHCLNTIKSISQNTKRYSRDSTQNIWYLRNCKQHKLTPCSSYSIQERPFPFNVKLFNLTNNHSGSKRDFINLKFLFSINLIIISNYFHRNSQFEKKKNNLRFFSNWVLICYRIYTRNLEH